MTFLLHVSAFIGHLHDCCAVAGIKTESGKKLPGIESQTPLEEATV